MEFLRFLLGINTDAIEKDSTAELIFIIIAIVALVLVATILVILCFKNNDKKINIASISFAGVSIGMSFLLSYIKIFEMPAGGSITIASILPVCLYAYIFGFKKGLLAGVIYSLLQLLQDPYILNFIQVLLDYTLGFSCVCLAGAFPKLLKKVEGKNKFCNALNKFDLCISICAVSITRFIFSCLSGMIFFNATFLFSAAYNSVLLIDGAIALAIAIVLQLSPQFMKLVNEIKLKSQLTDFANSKAENIT